MEIDVREAGEPEEGGENGDFVEFSSLLPDLSATIYGKAVNLDFDSAPALLKDMGGEEGEPIRLVKVEAIRLSGICQRVDTLLLLPGDGAVSDRCCGISVGQRMWRWPADRALPAMQISLTKLADLGGAVGRSGDVEALASDLTVTFTNIRNNGGTISGKVVVKWSPKIGGSRIDIISLTYTFSIRARKRIFEDTVDVFGVPVEVWADLYLGGNPPNKICVEVGLSSFLGDTSDSFCKRI